MGMMKTLFVGDERMIRDGGDYVVRHNRLRMKCMRCGDMKEIRYADKLARLRGVLLTLKIDFFCKSCGLRVNIDEGDVIEK